MASCDPVPRVEAGCESFDEVAGGATVPNGKIWTPVIKMRSFDSLRSFCFLTLSSLEHDCYAHMISYRIFLQCDDFILLKRNNRLKVLCAKTCSVSVVKRLPAKELLSGTDDLLPQRHINVNHPALLSSQIISAPQRNVIVLYIRRNSGIVGKSDTTNETLWDYFYSNKTNTI